jgi:hypothetical protein
MENKEEMFIKELKYLMEKYGIVVEEYDDYDQEEKICGNHFAFKGKGINVYIEDL